MEASQALATITSSQTPAQLAELEQILLGEIELPDRPEEDAAAQSMDILRQILGAQTEAEVEAFGNAVGWRELARRFVKHDGLVEQGGIPVEIVDFNWMPSEYQEGPPVYFVIRATALGDHEMAGVTAGDSVILTTGSLNVLAQILAWDRLAREGKGQLRGRKVIAVETEKATKGGYWPIHLETVKTAVQAAPADEAAA